MAEGYTTVPKAAEALGLSRDALRRWIERYPTHWARSFQPYPGASWRISLADLRERMERRS